MLIEKYVKEYLEAASNISVPVYLEKPIQPPVSYILIEKTGSGSNNLIPSAVIAIQSYASSMFNAASLNEAVKTALMGDGLGYDTGICSTGYVSKVRLNSDYNATDTTTKSYRYQAVFDLVYFN